VSKKTRNRQLARVHERRVAERRAKQRKRTTIIVASLVVALVGLGIVGAAFLGGGDGTPAASGAPTPSASPSGKPGTQTGTVQPQPAAETVACGADAPTNASEPKPQFNAPAKVIRKGTAYTTTLQTSCGDIVIELLADQAPKTVNSFVFLAQQGYFDGQYVTRLDTSIDVIQGGDPTGTGSGGPGYSIPDELTGKESYGPGVFAMANGGPGTGGSQFFIITGDKGHLLDDQGAWTIFGNVTEGLDVARTIQQIPVQDPTQGMAGQQPSQAVYIEKVTVQES
jgi:cyclophilin family peptidyl-prolyl cis-trans isomerase